MCKYRWIFKWPREKFLDIRAHMGCKGGKALHAEELLLNGPSGAVVGCLWKFLWNSLFSLPCQGKWCSSMMYYSKHALKNAAVLHREAMRRLLDSTMLSFQKHDNNHYDSCLLPAPLFSAHKAENKRKVLLSKISTILKARWLTQAGAAFMAASMNIDLIPF